MKKGKKNLKKEKATWVAPEAETFLFSVSQSVGRWILKMQMARDNELSIFRVGGVVQSKQAIIFFVGVKNATGKEKNKIV